MRMRSFDSSWRCESAWQSSSRMSSLDVACQRQHIPRVFVTFLLSQTLGAREPLTDWLTGHLLTTIPATSLAHWGIGVLIDHGPLNFLPAHLWIFCRLSLGLGPKPSSFNSSQQKALAEIFLACPLRRNQIARATVSRPNHLLTGHLCGSKGAQPGEWDSWMARRCGRHQGIASTRPLLAGFPPPSRTQNMGKGGVPSG